MEIKNTGKIYHSSHSMVYSCQYHVIFCPKYRKRILKDDIEIKLKELIKSKEQEY